MNQQLRQKLLTYALITATVLCIIYLLSAFGILDFYPHFWGDSHPHKWHTLFRLCFVIVFAVVNHWFLVPRLYIQNHYLSFFAILLICMVSLWVLPDLLIRPPKFDPFQFSEGKRPPPFMKTFLVELAHVYLLFFIGTFASIAQRTQQYIQKIEQKQTVIFQNTTVEKEVIFEEAIETALTVTVNYSLMRIEFSEIQFIKSMDNYLQFHLKDKKPLLVRMTLKEAVGKLPPDQFLRVHKSYIVAVAAIESVRNKTIFIAENEIPIGRVYEEAVSKFFKS